MSHKCHAIGCEAKCKPEYLMCGKHWAMLPKPRQRSVLREYRAGQCQLDPAPSPQWHDAADAAIYWIKIAEQKAHIPRWVPVEERLPEIGDRFLVYDSFYENKRDDTGFCIQFGRITESWGITPVGMNGECPTVTHWMPLPPEPLETEE